MNRRKQIELSPEEQREYLASARTLVLSTIDGRGYPHSVAMWFALLDGVVHMTSFRKAQKVVNLRRNPRFSLLAESGQRYSELRGLMIRGQAEIVDDLDLCHRVMLAVQPKYFGEATPEMRAALLEQARKRVVLRFPPERVASWDHTKLGGVY